MSTQEKQALCTTGCALRTAHGTCMITEEASIVEKMSKDLKELIALLKNIKLQ